MAEPALTDAIQDYLKEIYKLQAGGGRVSVTAVTLSRPVADSFTEFGEKYLAGGYGALL